MGTVTFYDIRFLEDEVHDGDFPHDDDHTTKTVFEVNAVQAAHLIMNTGLTFAATGTDWAASPDGSYVSNYATGERVESSAHLSGFPDRVVNAIISVVG